MKTKMESVPAAGQKSNKGKAHNTLVYVRRTGSYICYFYYRRWL